MRDDNRNSNLLDEIRTAHGLSRTAIQFLYRLQSLKTRRKYVIMLVKLGDRWLYEISEGNSVEVSS